LDAGGVTAPGAPLTTLVGTAVGATDVCGAATTAVAAGTLINTKLYRDIRVTNITSAVTQRRQIRPYTYACAHTLSN
jgi:hypothetical protein